MYNVVTCIAYVNYINNFINHIKEGPWWSCQGTSEDLQIRWNLGLITGDFFIHIFFFFYLDQVYNYNLLMCMMYSYVNNCFELLMT